MTHGSLYLTYDGLTDPLGQSQILPYLLGLEEKGMGFHIVSFEKDGNFEKHGASVKHLITGKKITWHPLKYHKKPPVFSTLLDILTLQWKAKKVLEDHNIGVVHCRSYITALVGLRLKRKAGLKFIFDMRGFWVNERIEGKIWNVKNPLFNIIYNYFKGKEKQFFKESDAIISLTENAKSYILKQYFSPSNQSPDHQITKSPNQPITVIPCCADLQLFNADELDSATLDEVNAGLNKDYTFKLLYLGSLGTWYLFDAMLDFFEALCGTVTRTQFLLLTNDLESAEHLLVQRGWSEANSVHTLLDNTLQIFVHAKYSGSEIAVTQTSRKHVPAFVQYSDASIMFIKPSFSKIASSATKMGEVLAMGKPVITNTGWGDVDLFQSKIENFYMVSNFDQQEYRRVIQELIKKSNTTVSNFAMDYFSLQRGIEHYRAVYERLLK